MQTPIGPRGSLHAALFRLGSPEKVADQNAVRAARVMRAAALREKGMLDGLPSLAYRIPEPQQDMPRRHLRRLQRAAIWSLGGSSKRALSPRATRGAWRKPLGVATDQLSR